MSKKAHCRCKPAECEECPEWIFTFADLVMLMMGFFVILWVTKPAPGSPKEGSSDDKWLEVVAKIREAFGRMPDPTSKDPVDIQALMKKIAQIEPPFNGPGHGADTKEPPQAPKGHEQLVMNVRPGAHVTVGGRLQFAPGSAAVSPATKQVLDELVTRIRGYRNIFLVKGHTSLDDYADGATPQQLMDLSLRRAQACADYLTSQGVSPDTVRVQGCSTFEPVVQHEYGPDAQTDNRRVEVEATDQLVRERQDASSNAAMPRSPAEPKAAESPKE
jgi:outer membrane protein OmpA-like peptidoglycan-associated protein